MAKIDPYKHAERFKKWKANGEPIPGVSEADRTLILRFIRDMEVGINVRTSRKRGGRSVIRLNTLRVRIPALTRKITERFDLAKITDLTDEQVLVFFSEMRQGQIRKDNGERYRSAGDFVKDFKSFWHWYVKVSGKEGRTVPDITADLDTSGHKPPWVYLTEDEVKQLCSEAKFEYRVLMTFLLDSGVRSPTELVNIRVADFADDFTKVHIRDEISKTFGRRINLLLSSKLIQELVRKRGFVGTDSVFPICPPVTNRYLKRLAKRVLGDSATLAGEKYSNLTLYDFRHVSACYWLPRYKSESALKYRFGWKQSERIHYYTELLGMRDTITEDDVMLNVERTEIERRLATSERERHILQERLDSLQQQMQRIATITEQLLDQAVKANQAIPA